MANHEMNITCTGCGDRFDLRLHGTHCPQCKTEYKFNPNNPKTMSKQLFHINDSCLFNDGFLLEEDWDRDSHLDKHNSIHIKTFLKHIDEDMKIEVVFGYSVAPCGLEELKNSNCYLVVGDVWKLLKYTSIWQLKDLFISIKQSLKEAA